MSRAVEGHLARKRFGQNFLHDPNVIARIVAAIRPQPGERVVEIGPGLGALTQPLLEKLDALDVIEIDRDLAARLRETHAGRAGFVVHQADALRVDYAALAGGTKLRLVGNLPYNISTPLLFHLLKFTPVIADMHFMLQKEVVDRMAAAPDTDDYGRLTVTLAARAEVQPLFEVGPGAFRPAPQVDSAVVRLIPRPPPFEVRDLAVYDRIATAAFSQRRKTLANALRGLLTAERIAACGIDPRTRAETLPPATFARLAAAAGEPP